MSAKAVRRERWSSRWWQASAERAARTWKGMVGAAETRPKPRSQRHAASRLTTLRALQELTLVIVGSALARRSPPVERKVENEGDAQADGEPGGGVVEHAAKGDPDTYPECNCGSQIHAAGHRLLASIQNRPSESVLLLSVIAWSPLAFGKFVRPPTARAAASS